VRPSNNAMQLTKGGWMRVEALSSASAMVFGGEVVRPSQLIASVGWTTREREGNDTTASRQCRGASFRRALQLMGFSDSSAARTGSSCESAAIGLSTAPSDTRAGHRLALQRGRMALYHPASVFQVLSGTSSSSEGASLFSEAH
jgi:hypothetical protein